MYIRKHVAGTTIALEPPFWSAIARLAGREGIKAWTERKLAAKPLVYGNASWIRQEVLKEVGKQILT